MGDTDVQGLLNKVWPEWKIVKTLGKGSFGQVYEIHRQDIGGSYRAALKVISIPPNREEFATMTVGMDWEGSTYYFETMVESMVKEFAAMEKLKGNTNIVSYEDHRVIRHEDGTGWEILIRMELLKSLSSMLKERELEEADVVRLGIHICRGLELCQEYQIIHRDIKPDNIFISELGNYKLGDFGIARTSEKASAIMTKTGTKSYMAPEVYRGEPYNFTVDIYSLGLVLYWIMNGKRSPFVPLPPQMISFHDTEEALERRLRGDVLPPPIHGSSRLKEIILRACAYDPGNRYSSPAQMREALEGIQSDKRGYSTENNKKVKPEKTRKEWMEEQPVDKTQGAFDSVPIQIKDQQIAENVQGNTENKKHRWMFVAAGAAVVVAAVGIFLWSGKENKEILQLTEKEEIIETVIEESNQQEAENAEGDSEFSFTEAGKEDEAEAVRETEVVEDSFEINGEIVLGCQTNILLAGDQVPLRMAAGSFLFDNASEGLSWSSDNEEVAVVDGQGIVTGMKPGRVTLRGTYHEQEGSWEMTVAEVDKESGISLSADYDRISIGVGRSDTIELTIKGIGEKTYYPSCYASEGLSMNFSYGQSEGETFTLEMAVLNATVSEGEVTVLIYDEENPDCVVAAEKIHIRINE